MTYYNQRIEDDAIKNSLGVRRELVEGIRSLPGWRKGVRRKKTETRWKIVGGSRKAYQELGRINLRHRAKVWTMRWELIGSLLGLRRRYQEDR
ncbi:hypothetical protein BHE74_00054276 [Ensete ventricosum]|nr:hypothetical protein BHE74_00054276 [Ensete ventricosum]